MPICRLQFTPKVTPRNYLRHYMICLDVLGVDVGVHLIFVIKLQWIAVGLEPDCSSE